MLTDRADLLIVYASRVYLNSSQIENALRIGRVLGRSKESNPSVGAWKATDPCGRPWGTGKRMPLHGDSKSWSSLRIYPVTR